MAEKFKFEGAEQSADSLESVRENILDKLLVAISLLAIFPLAASLYRYVNIGWQNVMYFQVTAYLLYVIITICRKKITYFNKALMLIFLCFLVGASATINLGLIGSGVIFLLFSTILSTMFLGTRYGSVFITAGLALLIVVTVAVNQGRINYNFDFNTAALTPSLWIAKILTFAFFTAILIFSLGRLINYLVNSSNILREHSSELEKINKNLESEIIKRKEAERSEQESEEKYRLLIENIPSVTWISNEQGKTVFISPNVEKVYGFSQEEIYEKEEELWFGRVHPDDAERVKKSYGSLFSKGPKFSSEYRIQNKSGEWIWIYDEAILVYEEKGVNYAYGIFSDITERKQAGEALRESEERFRLLSEASFEGIAISEKGVIIDANRQVAEMFGYEEQELIGMEVMAMVAPESMDLVTQNIRSGFQEPYEHLAIKKDGSIVHVAVNGKTIPYEGRIVRVTAINDITERKKSEKAVKRSEEQYRILYENANDGICIIQNGVIKFPNPIIEELTGYSKDELVKMPFTEIIHPEDRAMVMDRYTLRLAGGKPKPTNTISFRIITKKDKELWVQTNAVINAWEGHPASLNFLRDITQQKKLEIQLQQSHKMESIGTLAGGIAHDFNNILSPIMAYSEMAIKDLPHESPTRQDIQQIYKAGERAKNLVKQILTFARQREKERIPLKASRVIEEVMKFLKSAIPSTINIKYDCNTEKDTVLADPTQMNQIVMNICTNASQAMSEKGGDLEIILKDEYLGPDDITRLTELNPGQYLRLTVRDSGTGISPDIIDKIFEPYFTTKSIGKGTGLGLAVVHGIIKDYEGDIIVESEIGKGTTIHVLLPLVDLEIPQISEKESKPPEGSEQLLIVDDEKPIADMVKKVLEKLGYKVTAWTNSLEALEDFRLNPDKYDLVITDMTMPHMTGKDLAKELMDLRPGLPVILCTGFSEQINEKSAREAGISAFIMKPISMYNIASTIREVLDGK